MPDMLGHGKSDRLIPGSAPALVQDLADLLAGLGLQKFALLGHSLGALTAAQFAAQYPERTACLILEDIPWFEPTALPAIPQDAYSASNPTIIAQLASGDLAQRWHTAHSISRVGMRARAEPGGIKAAF
jgi:pimeloyl-ACP methyl ester carboxylesterase